jgi:hypothetical protein
MRNRNQFKILYALVMGLGLMLAPGLFANPGGVPNCPTPSNGAPCRTSAVPEPSAIPELLLCLAVTASGLLFWRRNRQSV